jgi:DNA-directed RNA polymerase III subunit RPC3
MAAAYRVIHAKADDAKNSKGPALSNRAHSKKVISNGETFTGGNKISTNGYNGDRSSTKRKASVDVEIGSDVGAGNRGEVGTAESNGINGSAKVQVSDKPDTHVKSDVHMHSILYRLLKAGWIVPVAKRDFWSTSDQRLDAEVHVLEHHYEKGKVPKGPKQMKALQGLIKQRMHQLREQTLDFSESSSIQTGSKRPSAYTELPPSKRAKTNGVNGSSHFTSSAEDENILLDVRQIVPSL